MTNTPADHYPAEQFARGDIGFADCLRPGICMKFDSHVVAVAIAFLIAGCGGGGGGGGSGDTTSPAPNTPPNTSTNTPPVTTPVVIDTVTIAGLRTDYSITRSGSGYTVKNSATSAVTNVDSAVTTLRFNDITINLTAGSKAAAMGTAGVNELIDLYIASLSRVPDADTLVSLINRRSAGLTMAQLANELYAQAILNPSLTGYSDSITKTSDFVEAVYKYAFGRFGATAPTAGEVATWSARIDTNGISRGALILEMVTSARSGSGSLGTDGNVVALLNNKLTLGRFFAVEQGINYNSVDESLNRRTAIATAVTSTDINAAKALIGFTDASFNLTSG